jgi:TATA-box binding protein (TBP) (component of TFIID and TFIIIB)
MKKRIGLWAPLIYCTLGESITLQAIHELTHHIQHDQNRKYSEVETTLNEIEYAKEYYPGLYRKLEKIN